MDEALDPSANYPVEEVAALKGVPYATVRSAIVRGELAANTNGRVWLVRGADLVAWVPHHWRRDDDDPRG